MFREIRVGDPATLLSHMSSVALRARLGDPSRVPAGTATITTAIETLLRNAELVSKQPGDMTRPSMPEKHAAAREIAQRTQAILRVSAATLADKHKALWEKAVREADRVLGLSNDRLETEVRQHISAAVKTPEGMAKVSELARTNTKVASVIYGSPDFLLGIGPDLHKTLKMNVVETHAPEAFAALEQMGEIDRILPSYSKIEREIGAGCFNNEIAKAAETRVNIEG